MSDKKGLAQRRPRNRRKFKTEAVGRELLGKLTASDLQTVRAVGYLSLAQIAEAFRVSERTASRQLAGKASFTSWQFLAVYREAEAQAPDAVAWCNAQAGPVWYHRKWIIDRTSQPGFTRIDLMPE